MSILEVLCRTDSAKLLEKTVLPRLTEAMKVVTKERIHIWTDTQGRYHACYVSISPDADVQYYKGIDNNDKRLYVTGNLVFYAMVLGR